jgi:hypothetical protein
LQIVDLDKFVRCNIRDLRFAGLFSLTHCHVQQACPIWKQGSQGILARSASE